MIAIRHAAAADPAARARAATALTAAPPTPYRPHPQVLYSIAELVKNYCVVYLVDTTEVPDFNTMYELYDPCTVMFFYRNKARPALRRRPRRRRPRQRCPREPPSPHRRAARRRAAHHD